MQEQLAESRFQGQTITQQVGNRDFRPHLGMAEIVLGRGSEPPLLQHRQEDVAIYVLRGRLSILVDTMCHEAAPGFRVLVPRNHSYGFAVTSKTARLLMIVTPGGVEDWFLALQSALASRAMATGTSSWGMEQLVSTAAHYAIDIVGPAPQR